MKTLTIAEAREKLPSLLKRAREGEDIGIISGNTIIQLKPVDVVAWENGYLFQEYGVTSGEWEGFKKRQHSKLKADERGGTLKYFSGFPRGQTIYSRIPRSSQENMESRDGNKRHSGQSRLLSPASLRARGPHY